MTEYNYVGNIPLSSHNPSVDQIGMQTNNNSIANLIDVDHSGFNQPNGGYHTVIHLLPEVADPVVVGGVGELYIKQIASINNDEALFYQSGGGRNYQLTMNLTPQIGAPNGYSFLPGGILMQWGTININDVGTKTTVTFPQTFTNAPVNISITPINSSGSSSPSVNNVYVDSTFPVTTTQFRVSNTSSGQLTSIYWMAIGT